MGGNTLEVPDIPHTSNMKNVELAVQKMIHGREVKKNDTLKNPETLNIFADIKELNY
jgi:acetoacetyl-CoA synthetase